MPPFLATGNSEAIDLICRRYPGCGSPSLYLRQVATIGDIALDYASARHHRQKEMDLVSEWLAEINRDSKPGEKPDAMVVTAKGIQCLAQIMSSR